VTLERLVREHSIELVAIGNGTASRETDKLAAELIKRIGAGSGSKLQKLVVSEAGASVYSASALAAAELPGMDVSLRGAVSIARRLQDPLAELVKIEPKAIGVGQYQHDVTPAKLDRSLDAVVEDCVNAVGVDVNTGHRYFLAGSRAWGRSSAKTLSLTGTNMARLASEVSSRKCPGWAPRPSNNAPASLGSVGDRTPLTPQVCTPKRTWWLGRSWPLRGLVLATAGQAH
jgi:uncharacterized protein